MKRLTGAVLALLLLLVAGCGAREPSVSLSSDSNSDITTAQTVTTEAETRAPAASDETLAHTVSSVGVETDSDAWCVLSSDGSIYMAENEFAPYAPASITKVLTALVVVRWGQLDAQVTITEAEVSENLQLMSSGVSPSLKPGEKLTVRDLLYALLLSSTNAAANVLADYIAGSSEGFAAMMNAECARLGLTHSNFVNAHGLDTEGHYTCAYDMTVILKAAMENETLRKIMSSVSYTIPETEYSEARVCYMGHPIVNGTYSCEGVFAGKSGNTNKAKATLVTAVSRGDTTFYVCTLHSDDQQSAEDTCNLIETAYASVNGTVPILKITSGDIAVTGVDSTGITFSWKNRNGAVTARLVYWSLLEGTSGAQFIDLGQAQKSMSYHVGLPAQGAYSVQMFCTDAAGTEYGRTVSVLYTGSSQEAGMIRVNGCDYIVDEKGLLRTGTVETGDGTYYIYADGSVGRGFVGGRFYAGSDGRIVTGWVEAGGEKFFCQADGRIAVGDLIIDGTLYHFNENGALIE